MVGVPVSTAAIPTANVFTLARKPPMPINWNDPAARFRLVEEVGPERYAALHAEHMRASTVSTAGGHAIRLVHSSRFGRLFLVGDTGRAFSKLTQAETHARKHPKARAIASQPAITQRRAQT
jgi:hypothetical protein